MSKNTNSKCATNKKGATNKKSALGKKSKVGAKEEAIALATANVAEAEAIATNNSQPSECESADGGVAEAAFSVDEEKTTATAEAGEEEFNLLGGISVPADGKTISTEEEMRKADLLETRVAEAAGALSRIIEKIAVLRQVSGNKDLSPQQKAEFQRAQDDQQKIWDRAEELGITDQLKDAFVCLKMSTADPSHHNISEWMTFLNEEGILRKATKGESESAAQQARDKKPWSIGTFLIHQQFYVAVSDSLMPRDKKFIDAFAILYGKHRAEFKKQAQATEESTKTRRQQAETNLVGKIQPGEGNTQTGMFVMEFLSKDGDNSDGNRPYQPSFGFFIIRPNSSADQRLLIEIGTGKKEDPAGSGTLWWMNKHRGLTIPIGVFFMKDYEEHINKSGFLKPEEKRASVSFIKALRAAIFQQKKTREENASLLKEMSG